MTIRACHNIILIGALLFSPFHVEAADGGEYISPLDYGLSEAKNGIERFGILEMCHKDAVKNNVPISYSGISSLDIEIPVNAEPIPLPDVVDFAGTQIIVKNTQKNMPLFSYAASSSAIFVTAESIDRGRFNEYDSLSDGCHLLIIKDENLWVPNRRGYNYGVTRKDVLVIEKGEAINSVTSQYDNCQSSPKVYVIRNGEKKSFSHIKFLRDSKSTKITYLFSINNCYDVTISDVSISTPQDNDLYGDTAIQISNSAKVCLRDVTINGTYSQKGQFGYGIYFDNVALFTGERIFARARWGVFGTNNVNEVILRDCDINRFDIHCYGRDVRCYNCLFSDMYNQFSSVFGEIYFENCTFSNFIPVLIESSYNAYTPYNLTFKECSFNLTAAKNCMVSLYGLEAANNTRPELSRKALPNIIITDCSVHLADDVKEWFIINTGVVAYKESLDYINQIEVNRLKVFGNKDFKVFSTDLKTTEPLKIVINKVKRRPR